MAQKYPIINGNHFAGSSVEVKAMGKTRLGVTAINYKDKLGREAARGMGSVSLGRTQGDYEATVDFEMLKKEGDAFLDDLGDEYGTKPFNIVVSYYEAGVGANIDKITNAVITEVDSSPARGGAPATLKFTLDVQIPISRNGKTIVALPAQSGADVVSAVASITG